MTGYPQDPTSSSSSPAEPDEPLVVLEFSSFEDFLNSCASRISQSGLFLEVEPRERVGSPLRFELRIRDGFRLLRGEGQVIRVHDPLPPTGDVAGVTVRFTSLDEASQKLLPVVLDHYHQRGVPWLDMEVESPGVEVEVAEQETAREVATAVTLEDLWEEFEVVADRPLETPADESSGVVESEPRLLEADQFVTDTNSKETGDELEMAPESVDGSEPGVETLETIEGEDSETEIAEAAVEAAELEQEIAETVEDEAEHVEEVIETVVQGTVLEEDPLDLAGVLPTAPGASISSSEDFELLPEEGAELEEAPPKPWWQRRELWLFLLMAFLGILVGVVVYLKVMDGYEWPWSSSSDRGQTTPAEVLVTDGKEVPDGREIIAVYDFEDPTQVEVRLGDAEGEDTTSESLTPSQSSRREPTPRARPKQAGTQNQKQASKQRKTPARPPADLVLTGVDRITWQESQDQTVLTLWGDGPFDTDQLVVFRLDTGTPRQVVKILGISRPFSDRNLAVGTSHVSAIRTGLHTGAVGQELHVVADLEDPAVRMRRVEPEGSQLHVYFSKL